MMILIVLPPFLGVPSVQVLLVVQFVPTDKT